MRVSSGPRFLISKLISGPYMICPSGYGKSITSHEGINFVTIVLALTYTCRPADKDFTKDFAM